MDKLAEQPHRRFNPLTREWVLVSPHRTKRPWQGKIEKLPEPAAGAYNAECYLCPGNSRAEGHRNPPYTGTFAFDNDFAALLPETSIENVNDQGLIVARGEKGNFRVVCFSERHDLALASMTQPQIKTVVDTWTEQYRELARISWVNY